MGYESKERSFLYEQGNIVPVKIERIVIPIETAALDAQEEVPVVTSVSATESAGDNEEAASQEETSRFRKVVNTLDKKVAPILDKPLRRIPIGLGIIGLGILNMLMPAVPLGTLTTIAGVGILFGIKPSTTVDAVISFFKRFRKKEEGEEKSD